jgi:uncharacterized membrane protein
MTELESILGSYLSVMVLAACLLVMSTLFDLLRIPYQSQLWCAATLSFFALLFVLARFGGLILNEFATAVLFLLLFTLVCRIPIRQLSKLGSRPLKRSVKPRSAGPKLLRRSPRMGACSKM